MTFDGFSVDDGSRIVVRTLNILIVKDEEKNWQKWGWCECVGVVVMMKVKVRDEH